MSDLNLLEHIRSGLGIVYSQWSHLYIMSDLNLLEHIGT